MAPKGQDHEGPKKSPTRIWVKTKDIIAYNSITEKSRGYELREKDQRKLDDASIAAATRRTLQNNDETAGGGMASRSDTARQMVRASTFTDDPWKGQVGLMADVKSYGPEPEAQHEENDEEEDEEQANSDEEWDARSLAPCLVIYIT